MDGEPSEAREEVMKVVINTCYGGFGLSYKATMRYAELKGLKLYPFVEDGGIGSKKFRPYIEGEKAWIVHYATEPLDNDGHYIKDAYWASYRMYENRHDPLLARVVEELGDEANGSHAELRIIEIPDGVDYEVDEYDGIESIHEKHRSWG
jgi:hypothetical protein